MQSRYYNPETGRFINADGMLKASHTVLGHNMFTYTENNPVMHTDPSGYCLANANGDSVNPEWRPRCNPYDQYPGMNGGSWGESTDSQFYKSNIELGVFTSIDDLIKIYAKWIGIPYFTLGSIVRGMKEISAKGFLDSASQLKIGYIVASYKIMLFTQALTNAYIQLEWDGYYHVSKTTIGPITIGIWVKDNMLFYNDEVS